MLGLSFISSVGRYTHFMPFLDSLDIALYHDLSLVSHRYVTVLDTWTPRLASHIITLPCTLNVVPIRLLYSLDGHYLVYRECRQCGTSVHPHSPTPGRIQIKIQSLGYFFCLYPKLWIQIHMRILDTLLWGVIVGIFLDTVFDVSVLPNRLWIQNVCVSASSCLWIHPAHVKCAQAVCCVRSACCVDLFLHLELAFKPCLLRFLSPGEGRGFNAKRKVKPPFSSWGRG